LSGDGEVDVDELIADDARATHLTLAALLLRMLLNAVTLDAAIANSTAQIVRIV
jgi:hypothetical protein